jgi:hypothetical protein
MKSTLYNLLRATFILLILVASCKADEWLDIVKREIDHLRKPYPDTAKKFVTNIQSLAMYSSHNFQMHELDNKLQEINFSEQLKNKIRSIVWSDSITFQGFTFSQAYGISHLNEMAGVVRKVKEQVDLFYFGSETNGDVLYQLDTVANRKCTTFFDIEIDCWNEYVSVFRALYMEEINIVADALRSRAYDAIYEAVTQTENSKFHYVEPILVPNTFLSTISPYDKVFEQVEKYINELLETFKQDEFIMQLPKNASEFIKAIQQDYFYSILGKDLDKFFETFVNNLKKEIPENHAIYLESELKAMDDNKYVDISSLIFFITNSEGNLDLFNVVLILDKVENSYRIKVRKMKTNILIKDKLLVSKFNDGKINSLVHLPKDNRDYGDHLKSLVSLFQFVCQNL